MTVIANEIASIFKSIEVLAQSYPPRKFTIDGRLVGDIGEVIAGSLFKIELDKTSRPKFDAKTLDGQDVQIKATFKESLTYKHSEGHYIGLKLDVKNEPVVIYNGPAHYIQKYFKHRKGLNEALLSFPIETLRIINQDIPKNERVPLR